MSGIFSGSLEDKIEKYDLRYDYQMEQEAMNEFADSVQDTEDYLETVKKFIAAGGDVMASGKCTHFDVCIYAGEDNPQCSKSEGFCAIRSMHYVITDLSRLVK